MKNLFKINLLSLFVAAMCLTSCEEDVCYECTGITDADGTVILEDAGEYCEGEHGTREEIDVLITDYETLGGTCTRK